MRRCLCAVLLSCFLALGTTGSLMAADFTEIHAQQVYEAAQTPAAKDKGAKVTLSINGKDVVFTVTSDALGSVSATPVPGPDSASISIGLVKLQLNSGTNGLLTPISLQVVSSGTNKVVTNYSITYDAASGRITGVSDGAGGSGGAGGGNSNDKPLVGGIGGPNGTLDDQDDNLPKDRFPGFTAGQLGLPAGTKPGESNREPSPSVP